MINVEHASHAPASERVLPLLLLLFIASGTSALIYEIVWFQLLELVIGSSTLSIGVLLATFMGGLCLGSLGVSRVVSLERHPLLVYAVLELGIATCAILLLFGLPLVSGVYVAFAGHGALNVILRAVLCALLLLPPTIMMGATLPAVARLVESTPRGVSWLGILYTGNLVGAVLGCLIAGFYLLRVHDMAVATYVAASINLALAAIAFGLASVTRHEQRVAPQPAARSAMSLSSDTKLVHIVIALSGLTALGCQVVWTRVLTLLLGPTVYTFSIILAVFLIGLGAGSSFGSFLARTHTRPRLALGMCQLLLVLCLAWATATIHGSLPYWPIDPALARSPWDNFQIDFMRVMWAIFPAACLWGASFPLALAAAARPGEDAGRTTGEIYAANTIGAIVGALAFSTILVPAIGTFHSQYLLIGICLVAGLLMVLTSLPKRTGVAYAGAAVAATVLLAWAIPGLPGGLVAFGRDLLTTNPVPRLLFVGEGINSSVAVAQWDNFRSFHVSGRLEASTEAADMRLQRMLGHIPGLLHQKQPKSVLIVGFGAGVTAGSFVLHPSIERIVICEFEPLIPRVVSTYFSDENYNVLKDPRVEVIYDDARHYLLTTREKFDIITSDPIHPWIKGSATLYTKEYFELVKQHLNPGGLVTQWVPLYESSPEVVKSQYATFFSVFPRGLVFAKEGGWNTDTVLFAEADPAPIDVDRVQQRLDSPEYQRVRESLAEVEFFNAVDLLGSYAGRATGLPEWLKGAEINTDRNLRLQYLAGMASNAGLGEQILGEMHRYRTFPEDLFVGSEESRNILRDALRPPEAKKVK